MRAEKEAAIKLLQITDILLDGNHFPPYPVGLVSQLRDRSYKEQWELCIANKWYDVLLDGQNILQWRGDSFYFYKAPISSPSFEDFFRKYTTEVFQGYAEEELQSLEEHIRAEYDQAVDSLATFVTPLSVSYDYHPRGYRACIHPCGHFHFGVERDTRLASRSKISWLHFIYFIIRQFYPDVWDKLLGDEEQKRKIMNDFSSFRRDGNKISQEYWQDDDLLQLYLI